MSDTSYAVYQHYGTAAQRAAFTPVPPSSGQPIYIWYETDTGNTYLYDSSWHAISSGAGAPTNAEYLVEAAHAGLSAEVVTGTTYLTTAAYAARQAAAKAGRIFLPNDGFYAERDTGSAWAPWGPIFPFTVPVDGDFSWVNQGGASVDTTNGGIHLIAPAGAGENVRARVKAAPATPYTITAAFLQMRPEVDFAACGLLFRQSSDGKLVTGALIWDSTLTGSGDSAIRAVKYTNPTTFSANYTNTLPVSPGNLVFIRIADDGVNRITSYSADGQHWTTVHSVGRTDFLTADQVGFFCNANQATWPVAMTLLSWKQA